MLRRGNGDGASGDIAAAGAALPLARAAVAVRRGMDGTGRGGGGERDVARRGASPVARRADRGGNGVIVHEDWLLTPQRVAVHRPTATGVVADLHLGYDAARRRRGEAIPLANLAAELAPLSTVIGKHAVKRVVVAG